MIENLTFFLKILALILGMFSFFKFASKHKISELSELEFFLQINIKDYLIKTFNVEQAKKILKMDEEEFNKKNKKNLLKNISIAKSLINESNKMGKKKLK